MTKRSREQQLVDLCFEFSIKAYEWHKHNPDVTIPQIAEWVAINLRKCEFDTQPMGSSWGVLKNNDHSDIRE